MLLLTSTSDLIQLVTGAAVTSMNVHASFTDYNGTLVTPGRQNSNITGQATNTVVAAPGSNVQRNVKSLSVYNAHASSSNAVTLQHYDGSITSILCSYTLLAGETLYYTETGEVVIIDAAGGLKLTPLKGRLLTLALLTSASANFTTGPATASIAIRVQAGGGQGGGGLGGSSTASVGGGGGSGGYAEKVFAVAPNTAYAYTCGAGGSAQSTNVTGSAGTDSTFVVGGVTVTAKGGLGGIGAMAAGSSVLTILGGGTSAVATNGDVNCGGSPGSGGLRLSGTVAVSGEGGSSQLGAGGNAVITDVVGNVGVGYGAGGGGACSLTGNTRAGGAGLAGAIVIEEYS
jgi:hypothetical protein